MEGFKLPTTVQQLHQLIAIPSVSATDPKLDTGNRRVVELLATWLQTLGFAIELMPLESQPHKVNLIATLGSGDGGLVLAGHTDTVPFDESGWQSDPFILADRDNRLYGLGSADMKGFFPLAIDAAQSFARQRLKHPLIILATADEETSMSGARALVAAGRPRARYAVVGEPTGLRPVRLHKGMMMESVRLTGRSGHSSDPAYGASALEAMHKVIGALLALRSEWQARYQNAGFALQVPTLNLGCIHGGDNPNRICGQAELQFDLRPLPGMPLGELRSQLNRRLRDCLQDEQIQMQHTPLMSGVEAFAEDADSPLVTAAEKLTGHTAESVAFATEAPFLQQLGMQTIVLGPGDIAQAHQPNEYLGRERIAPMVEILRGLITKFCF